MISNVLQIIIPLTRDDSRNVKGNLEIPSPFYSFPWQIYRNSAQSYRPTAYGCQRFASRAQLPYITNDIRNLVKVQVRLIRG